jgi:hypothetical protein
VFGNAVTVPRVEQGHNITVTNVAQTKLTVYTGEPDVPVVELDPGEWLTIGEVEENEEATT